MQLAGQVRPLLARGELAGLTAQVALEPVALADVAGGAVRPDEHAVVGHARAVDLDQDVVAVGVAERQPHPVDRARVAGEPAEPGRGVAPRGSGAKTPRRAGPISSVGSLPSIVRPASLMNVSVPAASVTQTRSGDEATR